MEIVVMLIVCVFILPFLAALVMVGGLAATAFVAGFLYVVLWLAQVTGLAPKPN